jgi:GAF domain-containing protein
VSPPGLETGADLTTMLRAVRTAMATITATGAYDELIETIGDEVGRVVPYHSLRLFFFDDAKRELFPVAIRSTLESTETTDPSSPRLRLPLGRGVTGRIGETREPMLIDDIAAHPDVYYAPGSEPIDESFIGVPLVFRDELVGVLTVSQHGIGQYSEEMLALMEILGVAISAAIGNRRAVEAEARARREEERLRQLHTTFIGNISHELRTPLTTALGFLDLARER